VILVGLPGSGKSPYLERLGIRPLSSDLLRCLLADDETDQTLNARVFVVLRYLLRHRLAIGRRVTYIDATHLSVEERKPYFRIAQAYGCDVEALFFNVPLAVCKQRNLARNRTVPDEAMQRLAERLVPPRLAEGFTKVTIVGG
jgi:predicted kinase